MLDHHTTTVNEQITGRLKELYKLENGKYVAPAVVEKALLENEFIFQGTASFILYTHIYTYAAVHVLICDWYLPINAALLHGANKPFNTALIVPNWDKLGAWAVAKQIPGISISPTIDELKNSPGVQAFMAENIVLACKDRVKKYEMPQAWILLNGKVVTPLTTNLY